MVLAIVRRGQDTGLQQSREVILGQVEGRVGIMPLAANECIDRIPVGSVQLSECCLRLGAAGSTAWATRFQRVVGKPAGWADSFIHRYRAPDAQESRPGTSLAMGTPTLMACVPVVQTFDAAAMSILARNPMPRCSTLVEAGLPDCGEVHRSTSRILRMGKP